MRCGAVIALFALWSWMGKLWTVVHATIFFQWADPVLRCLLHFVVTCWPGYRQKKNEIKKMLNTRNLSQKHTHRETSEGGPHSGLVITSWYPIQKIYFHYLNELIHAGCKEEQWHSDKCSSTIFIYALHE